MNATDMHPPADRRCQIYVRPTGGTMQDLVRCVNEGTHWVKWGGCVCPDGNTDVCEDAFESWECDGHSTPVPQGGTG